MAPTIQIDWNHSSSSRRGAVGVNDGGWYSISFGTLEAEPWYHLGGTYDGDVLKVYKDGGLDFRQ